MKRQSTTVAIAVVLFLAIRLVGSAVASAASEPLRLLLDAVTVLLSGVLPACLFIGNRPAESAMRAFERPRREHLRYLLFLPLFVVSISLFASVLTRIGELLGMKTELLLPSDPVRLLLLAVLLPAFVEELLCRHLCFAPFAEGRATPAVWVSAILFALLHTNPIQIPYALLAGLFLGALAALTRSLWIPILFHLTNNLVSVLFFLLGDGASANLLEGVLLALAVLSVPLLFRRKGNGDNSPLASLWHVIRPAREDLKRILDLLLSPLMIPILLCLWLTAVACLA